MTEVTKTPKARQPRRPMTEFGQSLKGFVQSVNQDKLAGKVAGKLFEGDKEKAASSIGSFIRKAGYHEGVVSVRSKELWEEVSKAVVELDADLKLKADTLNSHFHFEAVSNANRDSATNWIVRMTAGESVFLKEGPNGAGMYHLEFDGEATEDTPEVEETED